MTSALPALADLPLAPPRPQRQRHPCAQLPPFLLPEDPPAHPSPAEIPDSGSIPPRRADGESPPPSDPGEAPARHPQDLTDLPVPAEAPPAAPDHQPAETPQTTGSALHAPPQPPRAPFAPAPPAGLPPDSAPEEAPGLQAAAPMFAQSRPEPLSGPLSGPQLPPLRLDPAPPSPPARGLKADGAAVQATPQPGIPPAPADIRISAPGEQALQVTLVAGTPDLRDRLAAARPDLRADLARVGAEVDLIAVDLRAAPGDAGDGSGLFRPDAGSGNMGDPNGNPGIEAEALANIQADSGGVAGTNERHEAASGEAATSERPAATPGDRPGERANRPGAEGGYPPPRPRVPPPGLPPRAPAGPEPSDARTIDRYA
jgi:hypothetical protein